MDIGRVSERACITDPKSASAGHFGQQVHTWAKIRLKEGHQQFAAQKTTAISCAKDERAQPHGEDPVFRRDVLKKNCEDKVPLHPREGRIGDWHPFGSRGELKFNVSSVEVQQRPEDLDLFDSRGQQKTNRLSIRLRLRLRKQGQLEADGARLGPQPASSPAPVVPAQSLQDFQRLMIGHQIYMKPMQLDVERGSTDAVTGLRPPGAQNSPCLPSNTCCLNPFLAAMCVPCPPLLCY
jgi:hypothetical protein